LSRTPAPIDDFSGRLLKLDDRYVHAFKELNYARFELRTEPSRLLRRPQDVLVIVGDTPGNVKQAGFLADPRNWLA
jgi:hypothetical protein